MRDNTDNTDRDAAVDVLLAEARHRRRSPTRILGIPASTARSRYQRAKQQLRAALSLDEPAR